MKKLLIVCGAGHATSTIAVAKVTEWLKKEGYENDVKIYQSKIADELNRIDDYDAVISTTIVPDSIKNNGYRQCICRVKRKTWIVRWQYGSLF